ncbi:hypothetical protein [Fibrobacter sp.]|uniref:hypothetical protein n=1 Tax=Fibrobacter sp. TaxID=35828 RepID=UPI002630C010|nr:hypothetical protein [Fibrobacter sp.]MDD5943984.1 hypothetical protein [Fibrobacter sp.]
MIDRPGSKENIYGIIHLILENKINVNEALEKIKAIRSVLDKDSVQKQQRFIKSPLPQKYTLRYSATRGDPHLGGHAH